MFVSLTRRHMREVRFAGSTVSRLPHPGTGEEAHLSAGPITGPAGQWWEVRLVRADGRPGAVAGQTAVDWWRSREAAQEGYRKRLRALQAAGWMRVD